MEKQEVKYAVKKAMDTLSELDLLSAGIVVSIFQKILIRNNATELVAELMKYNADEIETILKEGTYMPLKAPKKPLNTKKR